MLRFISNRGEKMKFVVFKGIDRIPGSINCVYSLYDVIQVQETSSKIKSIIPFRNLVNDKFMDNQIRKYAWRQFYSVDKSSPKKLKHEAFYRTKNLTLNNGRPYIKGVKIHQHELTGVFYMFVPASELGK